MSLKIFVVYHNKLNQGYYKNGFSSNYIFVNVSTKNSHLLPHTENSFNIYDLPNFQPLGSYYTESEVLYNIYYHPALFENCDMIGFLQYDIDSTGLEPVIMPSPITNNQIIAFQPYSFQQDYEQKILMDEKQPNTITGNGRNCYDRIFEDYNNHYSTNYKPADFKESTIALCSAFIITSETFRKMMDFCSKIIKSGELEKFDSFHVHRIQGGLMERYYAVWFLLQGLELIPVPLTHHFSETQKKQRFLARAYRKALNTFFK